MSNAYYTPSGNPGTGTMGLSATMRAEFVSIGTAFDLLPIVSGNANKAVVINGGGTAMTVTIGTLALAGNFSTTGAFNTVLSQSASTTLTLPGVNGTLATLAGSETLSNKTLVAPALGTPASGVLTNCTGTASGLTAGSVSGGPASVTTLAVSGAATFAGSVTSTNYAWFTHIIAPGFGVRIAADGTNAQSALQFSNNAGNAQWFLLNSPGQDLLDLKSSGGSIALRVDTTAIATTPYFYFNSTANHGSGSVQVTANSTGYCYTAYSASNFTAHQFVFGSSQVGSITCTVAATAYNTTSDQRLKEFKGFIGSSDAGLMVDALNPRWFQWRHAPEAGRQPGFYAQEVEPVFPWAVTRGEGNLGDAGFVPWQIDASKFMPMVIAELQSLRRRVKELEALA